MELVETNNIETIKPDVMNWLESVRYKQSGWGKWKYNKSMLRDYGAISSGYAIWILWMLDEIKNISEPDKQFAIDFFQSCQDPDTGLFMDPLVSENDLKGNGHSWDDVKVQMVDIKYGLDYLNATPKYRLPEKRFINLWDVDIEKWVMSLDWKNPWHSGWQWDQCLLAFSESKNGHSESEKQDRLKMAFEVFENNVMDQSTGLPVKMGCSDMSVGMAGLFKVIPTYNKLNRELPYCRKAIDSVLSLQKANGEFGDGGDMCINWDSVWVLREIDKRLSEPYKRNEIAHSMQKLANCLVKNYKKPDGGFAFHGDHCIEYHMSIHISKPLPEGDMVGTLQTIFCLQYADEYQQYL